MVYKVTNSQGHSKEYKNIGTSTPYGKQLKLVFYYQRDHQNFGFLLKYLF